VLKTITFKADEETIMMLDELKKIYQAKMDSINKEYGFTPKREVPLSEVIRSAILWQYDSYNSQGYIK
jgi:hypothetical protein